jgi:anti-sigma B factor antagonist
MLETIAPRIYVETISGIVVARFVDAQLVADDVVSEVGNQLEELGKNLGSAEVLLSFREVRFMSSTILAMLLKFTRQIAKAGGHVKLCAINPLIRDVFKITRFDRLFEIYDEEWIALESFEASHSL